MAVAYVQESSDPHASDNDYDIVAERLGVAPTSQRA